MTSAVQQSIVKLLLIAACAINLVRARGNFSGSCDNIRLNGVQFIASCRDKNGRFRWSGLNLNTLIANDDGKLNWRNYGGFAGSCVGMRIYLGHQLVATCTKRNGSKVGTFIDLDDHIANYDGQLSYAN